MLGKLAFFLGVFTSQSEAGGRTEGRRLSTKTSPKGEFEWLKATSTKCESLVVRVTFRIQFFWVFRVMMLIFLIFRAEAYTCWSARFARSELVVFSRLFKQISVFFSDSGTFSIFSCFSVFLVICGLFFVNRRLFIVKKRLFWPFYQISVFSGVGGFVKCEKKTVFSHFIRFRCFQVLAAS